MFLIVFILLFFCPNFVFAGCTGKYDCGADELTEGCTSCAPWLGCPCTCVATDNYYCHDYEDCKASCGGGCVISSSCSCTKDCNSPYCGQSDGCGGTCSNSSDTCTYGSWQDISNPTCGGPTQKKVGTNPCGGSCQDKTQGCHECQDCNPACGQKKDCGGSCGVGDTGSPGTPTCTSIGATVSSMPVTISWTSVSSPKLGFYQYSLDGGAAVGNGLNTSKNVTYTTGGIHNWKARTVNGDCGDTGPWSNTCTLCYETEKCTNKCGQNKDCGGGKCPTDDLGIPDKPVIVFPVGTSAKGDFGTTLACTQNPSLQWQANTDLYTDGYNIRVLWMETGTSAVDKEVTSVDTTSTGLSASKTSNVGGYYKWRIRGENLSCGTTYGPWSSYGYFCRECETCTPACGQATDCGVACSNADAGAPEVPVPKSPLGSQVSPYYLDLGTTGVRLVLESQVPLANYYQYRFAVGTTLWDVVNNLPKYLGNTNINVGLTGLKKNKLYSWQARAVNTDCGTTLRSAYSSWNYFMVAEGPGIDAFRIKNHAGTEVLAEVDPESGQNQNHICQTEFLGDRRVRFELDVSNAGGINNVNLVNLTWNGRVYTLSRGSTSSNIGGTYWVEVDYTGFHDQGIYEIGSTVTATSGPSASEMTSRFWKVWNCEVPVSGSIYNGSAGQVCDTAFNTLMPSTINFTGMKFLGLLGANDVVASVNSPSYSVGANNLIWEKSYAPIFNNGDLSNPDGDLGLSGRFTQLVDLGTGTSVCPVASQYDIKVDDSVLSPYSSNPRLGVNFSFIRDQESWYQVVGAGVKAKTQLKSGVPITVDITQRALSLAGAGADNGLVSYSTYANSNGCSSSNCFFGIPNNWSVNQSTNETNSYSYQYFYDKYLVNGGIGVTGNSWSQKPSEGGLYFVNGDLNIDNDLTLASGKSLIVIAKGKIDIAETVSRLDGIFIANNGIGISGESDNQLVINGMLYSSSKFYNIRINRSFTDKSLNNTTPPVKVNYQPSYIFNLPGNLMRVLSGWREE